MRQTQTDRPIVLLTIEDLRSAHLTLARFFENDPEPIPPWDRGDIAKLEMCTCCSEVEAFGVQKYPDIVSKTAKLFYSTIKLHPFPNGNKRFGLMVTILFLIKNRMRLDATYPAPRDMATMVAESDPHSEDGRPEKVIRELTAWFAAEISPDSEAARS